MPVELLAPAGDFEKLKTALYFGADAVYLGGKEFSLRAFADNFTEEELAAAVACAHGQGRKVYVTVNIFARNADFARLGRYFAFLQEIGADAALVTDAGALACARSAAPRLPLHLSTQANTTNKYAAKFWQEQGVSRVVLARELSLAEIAEIHAFCPDLELEAFVHGAMCISYSGRCLLSNYLDGRDSNRGACVQACRWRYTVLPRAGGCPSPPRRTGAAPIFQQQGPEHAPVPFQTCGGGGVFLQDRGADEEPLLPREHRQRLPPRTRRRAPPCHGGGARKVRARAFTAAYAFGENAETVNYENAQRAGTRAYAATFWRAAARLSCRCADGFASATSWRSCLRPPLSTGGSPWER